MCRTLKNAWDVLLVQLDAIAEQHNKLANGALNEVAIAIANYQKEKEKERLKVLPRATSVSLLRLCSCRTQLVNEGKRITKEYQEQLNALKAVIYIYFLLGRSDCLRLRLIFPARRRRRRTRRAARRPTRRRRRT